MSELMKQLERARAAQAECAQNAQACIELLYPVGAHVEYLADGSWVGPAVVERNRIGYVGAGHTPSLMVRDCKSGVAVVVNYEYVRPGNAYRVNKMVMMVNATEEEKCAVLRALEEAKKLSDSGELQ